MSESVQLRAADTSGNIKDRQWRTQEFCSGGWVQQIQLWTERTGIWGAVAP